MPSIFLLMQMLCSRQRRNQGTLVRSAIPHSSFRHNAPDHTIITYNIRQTDKENQENKYLKKWNSLYESEEKKNRNNSSLTPYQIIEMARCIPRYPSLNNRIFFSHGSWLKISVTSSKWRRSVQLIKRLTSIVRPFCDAKDNKQQERVSSSTYFIRRLTL